MNPYFFSRRAQISFPCVLYGVLAYQLSMQMKGSVTMDNMIPSNMIPSYTMGANVLPQPQMHYGYGYGAPCVPTRGCETFIIIIVLFILLIIIGAFAFCD